ncbi:hypothetical protein ACOMHN_046354 [Nucella lapillus]
MWRGRGVVVFWTVPRSERHRLARTPHHQTVTRTLQVFDQPLSTPDFIWLAARSFQARPLSYRISAVVALVLGVVLVVGVACPYWHQSEDGSLHGGLWSRCTDDTLSCLDLSADVAEGWWVAVQVLEALAVLFITVSCSALLFENCFSDVNAPVLLQEILAILGGLLGLIGCIVFVAKTEPSSQDVYATYSWSFYFAILGNVVVFIASLVILIGGKTAQKTLRLHRPDGQISPEPVRRFSHLWARESSATPEAARRALGSAQSRGPMSSFPPPKDLMAVIEPGSNKGDAELGEAAVEGKY